MQTLRVTYMQPYFEFAAVFLGAIIAIVTMNIVVGIITICAGLSTIFLNIRRDRRERNAQKKQDTP